MLALGTPAAADYRIGGGRHTVQVLFQGYYSQSRADDKSSRNRAGVHSATLHDRWFRHLQLPHLQLDELRTRLRSRVQVLWLWLALDPQTKLIPVLHLGTRTQHIAHRVVHELRQRLAPGCLPVFTSDGLNLYFYALTAHFGQWVVAVGQRAHRWQVAH